MGDGVEAHGIQVTEALVRVDRTSEIIVGADRALQDREVLALRHLGDEVDRPADRAGPVEYRIGAVIDFNLLEVERVRAAILSAIAHAVLGDVVAGRIAAQVDRVAIAAAASAVAEGDAGDGGERVPKGG